ncbi:MAG: dihydroneopterin aldolase, partial [Bacteroidales bacterium]|nr:dihydroneopterin aldolase [Bacteroidales bacterium]
NFSINLTLQVPFEAALRNDTLANTVNYASIYEVVKNVMSEPSKLLENVAGRIISSIKAYFPKVKGGRIAVYKENPPITGKIDRVGVIVEWQ